MKILKPNETVDIADLHWQPLSPEEEKEVLELARNFYSKEEIAEMYSNADEWIPAEELIAELERTKDQFEQGSSNGQ